MPEKGEAWAYTTQLRVADLNESERFCRDGRIACIFSILCEYREHESVQNNPLREGRVGWRTSPTLRFVHAVWSDTLLRVPP